MKAKLSVTVIALFIVFISCNKAGNKSNETLDVQLAEIKQMPLEKGDKQDQKIPIGNSKQPLTDSAISPVNRTSSNIDWDKKIIKTATLKLEVKDFKSYNDVVHKTVKQFGGYIAQEEQNLSPEKTETVISIKVPVEEFETMMNQLPGSDVNVMERKITTEDVTGEVVDTKSRLEAKKEVRLKYLDFLKQSKNMEEVMQVQNEINGIQEAIESAAGRVAYLSHQSAFSTINLTFYQPINGYKPSDGAPSFLTRLSSAFKSGGNWVADLFVTLISIWPLLLIILGSFVAWKKLKPSKTIAQNP